MLHTYSHWKNKEAEYDFIEKCIAADQRDTNFE